VNSLVLAGALLIAMAAHAVDITGCDQEVPPGEVGILTTDLDCGPNTVEGSYGVELEPYATLRLEGHTITGPRYAVYCPKSCTIVGPGTLTGAFYGIWAFDERNLRVDVSDVTIAGNVGGMAISRGRLTNVTVNGNAIAFDVRKLQAVNLTVTGCTDDSPYCIETDRARINGLTATGNASTYAVIFATRTLRLANAAVTDNTAPNGIFGLGRILLDGSTVTGHATDLLTPRRPRLANSVCGSSADYTQPPSTPWGVCAND
jgi:hypothetical protein